MLKILVLSAALVLAPRELVWAEDKDATEVYPVEGQGAGESLQLMERLMTVFCIAAIEGKYENGSCLEELEMQVASSYFSGTAVGL